MEATAIERAIAGRPSPSTPWKVRAIGGAPAPGPWALEALLGAPATVVAAPPGGPGLQAAMAGAMKGSGPELVVGADIDVGRGVKSPKGLATGDGAIALLIDAAEPGSGPAVDLGRGSESPSLLAPFFARNPTASSEPLPGWRGDWFPSRPVINPHRARLPMPRAEEAPSVVSEGAYVPRPRYLDTLRSRWRFEAEQCRTCGHTTFPARGRCRFCGRIGGLTSVALPLDGGVVQALTWIGPGGQPTEFDAQVEQFGTYGVALVALAPEVRATLPIADCEPRELHVGASVGTRLRRLYAMEGEWRYGRKALPLVASGTGAPKGTHPRPPRGRRAGPRPRTRA
jgi:uncharacterized OB-fold protein